MIRKKSRKSQNKFSQLFQSSCFGFLFNNSQIQNKQPQQRSIKQPHNISTTMFPLNNQKLINKPKISTKILQFSYKQDGLSWKQFIKDDVLIGVIGIHKQNLLNIPDDRWVIQINENSQINTLENLRINSLEKILAIEYDTNQLKKIFKSHQNIYVRITNESDLKQLVQQWQHIIIEESTKNAYLFKNVIPKLKVVANIVNSQYWVSINSNCKQLLTQSLKQLPIDSSDDFILNSIVNCLTAFQFWELEKKIAESKTIFGKKQMIEFLKEKSIILQIEDQYPQTYPLPTPKKLKKIISFQENIQKNQNDKPLQNKLFLSANSEEESFFLHNIDRYEDLDGEDDRKLELYQQKKYRTKSCSINPQQIQTSDELWSDNFILE